MCRADFPETGEKTVKTIFQNADCKFVLRTETVNGQSCACIVRHQADRDENDIVIFNYAWPPQLTVEVTAGEGVLREDGILCWELHVTAHHISGMAQGEFTETEYFEVESPFGEAEEIICRTVDIVRMTRFALAERHLQHLPHQTYPPTDGRQGPYGHL